MTIQVEVVLTQASFPARDQGLRPTCIAFALAELNFDAATANEELSPEYSYQLAASQMPVWVPGTGIPLGLALSASYNGQPVESDFPYQPLEPAAPVPAPPNTLQLHGGGIAIMPLDVAGICDMLRQHRPVGIGLRLTNSFYMPVDGVVAFEAHALAPEVLHAVAIVGLGWENQEAHFLIRNSWGAGWGRSGSAWVTGTYVRQHALCAFGA